LRLSTGNTAGHVARTLGLHGPNACYIGGQSTFYALSRAHRAISSGGLERALVVGGESVAASHGKVLGARAGCALLLTAERGGTREQLELLRLPPRQPALAAPFVCFESLNTLFNLMLLLEGKARGEFAYIEERDLSDQRRTIGVRRSCAVADARVSTIRQTTATVDPPRARRVVITAAGVVSPLGIGFRNFAQALFSGASAARPLVEAFGHEWAGLPVSIGAPVSDFVPRTIEGVPAHELERSAQFALEAVGQIVDQVGAEMLRELNAPLYCGVGAAQPLLDFEEARRLANNLIPRPRATAVSCELGSQVLRAAFGLSGAAQTFAGACSASTQACIQAAEEIRAGLELAVIAGGHDSLLSVPGLYMMHELGTLATAEATPARAVRPFDRDRDGTMVGEGAVYFLFEELEHAQARGAVILAEVTGWGSSLDGHHVTSPDPEGTYGATMIKAALSLSGIAAERVDYVNAHGTATLLNDATEARILQRALPGHRPWVSSSKPQLGHLIAACGAAEVAVCVAALMQQRLPPNLNFETPDPEYDLKLVITSHAAALEYVLSNSFGFGGQNSCILLKRFADAP
jgi:3-oxoacyl-[acyl-carrier-protein] synthase II